MSTSKEDFFHLIKVEIQEFYGIIVPEYTENNQIVYTVSRLLNIYEKRLYVNFIDGVAVNYRISYFIFNINIF